MRKFWYAVVLVAAACAAAWPWIGAAFGLDICWALLSILLLVLAGEAVDRMQ